MDLVVDGLISSGDRRSLHLKGSLDLASRAALTDAAAEVLAAPHAQSLAIDMSGITFIDSSGISALVKISNDTRRLKVAFMLEQPSDRVRRVLQLTGLLDGWTSESPEPGQPPASS